MDYGEYLKENTFHQNLEVSNEEYGDFRKKITKNKLNIDPENNIPYPTEIDDLIRLHYLITSRKVTTILEFGVGKSTIVFDHALEQNKLKYGDFVKKNLRRSNSFECHTVDDQED